MVRRPAIRNDDARVARCFGFPMFSARIAHRSRFVLRYRFAD
ncbi:transcriptional regulator [Burkholderia oklahomensis EO147]|nr:transcriptional regulator [Burkholderia oklahomensis EO147]AOI44871.1 transcriptional regulator [Burkholderia oklahomensis C6786]KUY63755.1 transcriptional regulator [Burkholderia oklahomensis EO147]KUY65337.1 transcriptional regulator [Burkholderia oklahomensis C6786]